jgi:serine/threonine protein phosphatase PrpC
MSGAQRDGEELSAAADDERPSQPDRGAGDSGRIAVRCAGRTAVGQVRDHNEDNFVVANLETGEIRPRDQACEDEVGERGLIFAVCDGMGGAAAGEVASQMAVDILVEAMRRGGAPKNRDALARRLVGTVEEAGRRIFDAAQKERSRRGMGTTATVAVLVDKVLFLAEVGDSRAYLLRLGQLKQLTKDQSLVNQLIEAGHLTEDEAEAFEHSNIILQALGTSESVQVDLTFVELRRGDRLMMCSDGLSGLVHTDTLRTTLEELKDPAECGAKLIEYAEAAGGHDNITVVVADFDGDGLAEPFDGDAFGYVQYPLPLSDDESGAFADEDTTGAGSLRAGEDDADEEDGDEQDEQDRDVSMLPLSDAGDARANLLWIAGGVLALLAALAVWLTLEPMASDDGQAHSVLPGPAHKPQAPSAQGAPSNAGAGAAEVAEEVDVNVHTDVQKATLVVNGEVKGQFPPGQSISLKLRPGAYRFEAQSAGSTPAVTVGTVRGDTPMDVFLELPKGASENAAAAAPGKDASQTDKATHPQKPQGETAPAEHGDAAAKHTSSRHHHASSASAASQPEQPHESAKPESTTAAKPIEKPAGVKLPTGAEASAQRGGTPAAAPPPQKPAIPDNPF